MDVVKPRALPARAMPPVSVIEGVCAHRRTTTRTTTRQAHVPARTRSGPASTRSPFVHTARYPPSPQQPDVPGGMRLPTGPAAPSGATTSRLARALRMLAAFEPDGDPLLLKQLTLRSGLSTGAAHRLSRELVDLGLLDRLSAGLRPGPELAELVLRASTRPGLFAVASPAGEHLHCRLGLPISLHVPSGSGFLGIAELTTSGGTTIWRAGPAGTCDLSDVDPAGLALTGTQPLRLGDRFTLAPVQDSRGRLRLVIGVPGCASQAPAGVSLLQAAAARIRDLLPDDQPESGDRTVAPHSSGPSSCSVLARNLTLLRCFLPGEHALRRADFVRRSALPRSTVYRSLRDLVDSGMLAACDEVISLGPLLRRLARGAVGPRIPPGLVSRLPEIPGVRWWITPVDRLLGVPLNGIVVCGPRSPAPAEPPRASQWAVVGRTVAELVAGSRGRYPAPLPLVTASAGCHAAAILLQHAGMTMCVTAVTERVRLSEAGRRLVSLSEYPLSMPS